MQSTGTGAVPSSAQRAGREPDDDDDDVDVDLSAVQTQAAGWLASVLAIAGSTLAAIMLVSMTLVGIVASWRFYRWLAELAGVHEDVSSFAAILAEGAMLALIVSAAVELGPRAYRKAVNAVKGDEVRANFTICQSCGVAIDREIADKRPSWQRGCPACRESLGGP